MSWRQSRRRRMGYRRRNSGDRQGKLSARPKRLGVASGHDERPRPRFDGRYAVVDPRGLSLTADRPPLGCRWQAGACEGVLLDIAHEPTLGQGIGGDQE